MGLELCNQSKRLGIVLFPEYSQKHSKFLYNDVSLDSYHGSCITHELFTVENIMLSISSLLPPFKRSYKKCNLFCVNWIFFVLKSIKISVWLSILIRLLILKNRYIKRKSSWTFIEIWQKLVLTIIITQLNNLQ